MGMTRKGQETGNDMTAGRGVRDDDNRGMTTGARIAQATTTTTVMTTMMTRGMTMTGTVMMGPQWDNRLTGTW
jgi:hypothetical protein